MADGQVDPTKNYINYYRYGHANVDVTATHAGRLLSAPHSSASMPRTSGT